MAIRRDINRRAAVAGLATTLVAATLLGTGAAGSLASELRPGSNEADHQDAAGRETAGPMAVAQRAGQVLAQIPRGSRAVWNAVSPWTHLGDRYSLVLTNGSTPQQVVVHTIIMDHRNQVNTPVLQEQLQLAAGERRELGVTNEYGDANHFRTLVAAQNDGLTFQVTLADSTGTETARFNQRAFNFRTGPPAPRPGAAPGSEQMKRQHGHKKPVQ